MKFFRKNKGITLVALVVTIVIMLILAGVTLNFTLGDNGLFKMAKSAVDKYQESAQNEEKDLDEMVEDLKHIIPEDAGKEVEIPKSEKDKWDLAKVTPTADGKGNTIPVPKGFYFAGGNIDTGFVISSASGDDLNNSKGGNQFVWIPCTAKQYTDAMDDVMEKEWASDAYKDNGDDDYTGVAGGGQGTDWSDNYESEDISNIITKYGEDAKATIPEITSNWENKQTEVAEQSIEKYGGFYVARYEAGVPSEATSFYTSPSGKDLTYKRDTASGGQRGATNKAGLDLVKDLKPVSKKGVQVWNWITQPNAKIVAENMYKGNGSVGSYLVNDGAWNIICNKFNDILGTSEEKETQGRTIINSTAWGNYKDNATTDYTKITGLWAKHGGTVTGWEFATQYETRPLTREDRIDQETGQGYIELPTGASSDFRLYNIYDMAGNVWEWTTGHNTKNDKMFVVIRGSSFDAPRRLGVAITDGSSQLTRSDCYIGFRVVLYIK